MRVGSFIIYKLNYLADLIFNYSDIIVFFLFRLSVCGSILQEMKCTEKALYQCLKLMAKKIR